MMHGIRLAFRNPEMQSFDLSPEQKADLIAFLFARTDERNLDQVP